MTRIFCLAVAASFLSLPLLALARPPLIYHQTTNMTAKAGADVHLILGSQDAQITVKPVKSVTVTVNIWANAGSASDKAKIVKRLAPTTRMQGNDVLVKAPETHGWNWSFGWHQSPQALVSVVMPPDMNVVYDLGSGDFHFDNADAPTAIQGESGSGDAFVNSASTKLKLDTGSGDMEVKLAGGSDSVRLSAGSGDIRFSGSADSLKLEAGSGDITVNDAEAKSISLETGSGDIVAHWRKLAADTAIEGNAGSGDIHMYFPADTIIGGKISADSGDVNTDFPATIHGSHHSYTLAGGAGAVRVELNTGSGDVDLRKGG